MIRYKLQCKKCKSSFDSWFASSKEYEKLKKLKHLICNYCNSIQVEKTLMAPSILNLKQDKALISKNKKLYKIKKKIKEYQKFVKENFNYVGENFAYEARSLKYNEKKQKKGIYGNATEKEISELNEEGIDIDIVPWFSENEN